MTKLIIKSIFIVLIISSIGCSEKNNFETLILENNYMKSQNDSILRVIDSLTSDNPLSYEISLKGTRFLPYSSKIIGLINNGLEPVSFSIIEKCEVKRVDYENYPKLIKVNKTAKKLMIDIEVVANTCHNFLAEAEVIGGDTLNLIFTGYGGFCSWGTCKLRYIFDITLKKTIIKYITINDIHPPISIEPTPK